MIFLVFYYFFHLKIFYIRGDMFSGKVLERFAPWIVEGSLKVDNCIVGHFGGW